MTLGADALALAYLVAAALFIFGLKGLTHPSSARAGNIYAVVGMVLAVAATLLHPDVKSYTWIVAGVLAGAIIGISLALRIKMTAMPQLVAMLHSFVGLCATLVAIGTYLTHAGGGPLSRVLMSEIFIGAFIGAITFTGSLLAFGKLQAILSGNPVVFRGQHPLNLAIFLLMLGFGVDFVVNDHLASLIIACVIAAVLGVTLILPIGGADMPVVISMLNSYSGWAAAATGFTLSNQLLIVTGALVGFSGAILSYIMSKAMNRSIVSIVLGGFGGDSGGDAAVTSAAGKGVKTAAVEDAVFLMANASKVLVVPGYGMAVAQAQHAIKEVMEILESKGVEVKFAIHPVAGRMPGHMNVLLAEADVPYDRVFEMEEINPEFTTADVALVVGANDVTNPAAKTDKSSPIYGMPIIEVDQAHQVIVLKRSMNPGFAGIDNDLFYHEKTSMLFGDAKASVGEITAELGNL
jgi:NAD(P) transhydrogenase subunit beta